MLENKNNSASIKSFRCTGVLYPVSPGNHKNSDGKAKCGFVSSRFISFLARVRKAYFSNRPQEFFSLVAVPMILFFNIFFSGRGEFFSLLKTREKTIMHCKYRTWRILCEVKITTLCSADFCKINKETFENKNSYARRREKKKKPIFYSTVNTSFHLTR